MRRIIFYGSLAVLLSACSNSSENRKCVVDPNLDQRLSAGVPQDMDLFKKSAEHASKVFLIHQNSFDEKYNIRFFAPWINPDFSPSLDRNYLTAYNGVHGENLHKWSQKEILKLNDNARMDSCPSVRIKAIAIKNTMSYRVPTEKPFFSDITKPGESYPFNNNIMNLISLGTPLLVMHISADKAWFLVSNCRFSGWVPTSDVAFVDENFIKEYTNNELFVAIDDDISLLSDDSSHRFLSKARMGVILPCTKGKKLLVPYMKDNGYAGFKRCSNHPFVKKPYAFTGEHIIEIAKKFLGTKYGWGGYLEDRDCSMMIRDFATIFGIFLPCGSGGMLFSKGHKSITGDKDDFLKKNATPFLTIVGTKGHVMIYVGTYKGKPILWHNIWGMRLGKQELGRYVIGKTVLTDLGFCGDIEDTSGSLGQKKADTMFDILRK